MTAPGPAVSHGGYEGTPAPGCTDAATSGRLGLRWLGQAGFWLGDPQKRGDLLIDPCLSSFLTHKYRGKPLDHVRLMTAPVAPGHLRGVGAVLCTHGHSDHLDPWTLSAIARANPACRVVVPDPARMRASAAGLLRHRLVAVKPGDTVIAAPTTTVRVLASAHEELEVGPDGYSPFVGYVIRSAGLTIYHSGDCVPYPGLNAALAATQIDVALLPVNGRDRHRLEHGVPGNFTFEEAVRLCADAGIPILVPHHFGMFAFNTADPAAFDRAWAVRLGVTVLVPAIDRIILLAPGTPRPAVEIVDVPAHPAAQLAASSGWLFQNGGR
jgi:L-ascorbate metabolism protein UlaG (beta-lactamase superfamily)